MRWAALILLLGCDIQGAIGEGERPGSGGAPPSEASDAAATAVASGSGGAGSVASSSSSAVASSAEAASSTAASSSAMTSSAAGSGPIDPEQLCVDTINTYRATLGLPPFQRWTAAESCSDKEALSDATTMKTHGAFGSCGEWGQNECPGWQGPPEQMIPQCLAMMWAEGPGEFNQGHGHYLNMTSKSFTKVAWGFPGKGAGNLWAVQDFH